MKFERAALLAVGCILPPEVLTSEAIEERLRPLYERLSLPAGRLEFASGIKQRRLWGPGERISDGSIAAARAALEAAELAPQRVGVLIHASVCREFLEPATACRVHHHLGLPPQAWVYDLSNACLGLINGAVQIATLVERGAVEAGIVVGTENSRGLLESTIAMLNGDPTLTRQSIKGAFASLTIGSGACAWLIADREKFGGGAIDAAAARAHTQHNELCVSQTDRAGDAMQPLMDTDSERLLEAGVEAGAATFEDLLAAGGLTRQDIGGSVCHQVGNVHRRRILERLGLPIERDFATFEHFGNTGSVALPTALAIGVDRGAFDPHRPTALLGIGSGINSAMLATRLAGVRVRIVDRAQMSA